MKWNISAPNVTHALAAIIHAFIISCIIIPIGSYKYIRIYYTVVGTFVEPPKKLLEQLYIRMLYKGFIKWLLQMVFDLRLNSEL